MTRVEDSHPSFSYVQGSPAPGLFEFRIDCPVCGRPLVFKAWWQSGPHDGFHGMTATANPALDWNTLTVIPSLNFGPGSAHGRKSTCTPHFTITGGNIQPR